MDSFYGVGLGFPFRRDPTGGRPVLSREETLVRESMHEILTTQMGERPFLTRQGVPYGTRYRQILFSDADAAKDILLYDTRRALDLWEPRILVRSVDAHLQKSSHGGMILFGTTEFVFRSTNRPDNFVLPYRLTPAT